MNNNSNTLNGSTKPIQNDKENNNNLKNDENSSIILVFNEEKKGIWLNTLMTRCTHEYTATNKFPKISQRFINCEKGNLEKSQRRWEATLKWRKENDANHFLRTPHPHFEMIKQNYPHYLHYRDNGGRPVYYEQLGKINLSNMKKSGINMNDLLLHYQKLSEFIWEYIGDHTNDLQQSITVLDLENIRLKHLTGDVKKFLKQANGFYGTHYPEKAYRIILINVPSTFAAIWAVVKRVVDKNTAQKILVVKNSKILSTLSEYIPIEHIPPCYGGKSKEKLGNSNEEKLLFELFSKLNDR